MDEPASNPPQAPNPSGVAPAMPGPGGRSVDAVVRTPRLPPYTRSLLKIMVPVGVTLAATKMPLRRVLELGPGTIIPLEKSYEEPLTLYAGDQDLAVGEAIKVGDKFGLRIGSMLLPPEKFTALQGKRDSATG